MTDSLTPNASQFDETVVATAQPVSASERINSIDMLRGVAVLGILVMNIYGFAMPFVAYGNPLAYGRTEPHNIGTWFVTHLFFDLKFMTIFSMLYGAGLILLMTRAEARGVRYGATWFRRNFWLLLIGAMHGYLIWWGDILFPYAIVGMIVFLFRYLPAKSLITTGVVILAIAPLLSLTVGTYMNKLQIAATEIEVLHEAGEELTDEQTAILEAWDKTSVMFGDPAELIGKDLKGYNQGYLGVVAHRQPTVTMMQTQELFFSFIWRVGGVMLIGMALMKLGVISGDRSRAFYKKMMQIGYGVGLPIAAFGAWNLSVHEWDHFYTYSVGALPNYIASLFIALGHIALVMTIFKSGALNSLMQRFAAVGRMAFTNYLMHSVILTTVFYGYGFGLYGQVPRLYQMGFVVAVIGLQLWISPIWLQHYRFGPAEWLWRTLTYWKRQPMRLTHP